MLHDVFRACVEVLEPGGRIAVNVANLGRKPYRSLSADVISILQMTSVCCCGRDHLAEGGGRHRFGRLGQLPQGHQPGAA